MIFVSVGTHEQQFNRLVKEVDDLKGETAIVEDVFIQRGYSTYVPRFCAYKDMITYQEMIENINEADIVITHGGPGSIMLAFQYSKIPIIVPRKSSYGEHVNNHQIDFTRRLEQENKIIAVYDIVKLEEKIKSYNTLCEKLEKPTGNSQQLSMLVHNLEKYCGQLEPLIPENKKEKQ